MACVKVFLFLVVALTVAELQHRVVAQEDFVDDDQQWAAGGISPLDSIAYWDSEAVPIEAEEKVDARGCCLPKTWTSTLFTEVKRDGRKDGRSLRFADVVYVDENNRRVAQDVTIPRGPKRNATRISYILLFKDASATLYTFSKVIRKCQTKVFKDAQFRPMCLPPNATLLASYTLGAGSRAIQSQSWGFLVRDRRATTVGSVVLTPNDCVPILVGERVYTRPKMTDEDVDGDRKRPQVTTIGTLYTNFATQIPDPSVFTPPSYCKAADDALLFNPDIDFATIIQRFVTIPY